MKKLFTKVMGTVVAASLAAGMFPTGTEAAVMQKGKTGGFLNSLQMKSESELKEDASYVEGEVIVLNAGRKKSINAFHKEAASMGVEVADTYKLELNSESKEEAMQVSLVKSDKYSTKELMEKFDHSSNVEFVQPNYKYHAMNVDTGLYNEKLWGIDNRGQNAGTEDMDINISSETMIPSEGEAAKEKVIAVIDSGVDDTNEELSPYIWNNPYRNRLKGEHGYDFINYDEDPADDFGHGTHCAGIIKSVKNSDNIKIMPLKFLGADGFGDTFGAIGAYNYIYTAQKLGVNVVAVNNSWGSVQAETDEILTTLIDMVGEKGAISVCAAGNDSKDIGTEATIPACIESPYVVSVAATNEKGELASFSNFGAESVDLAAPGADILSNVSYHCFNPSVYGEDENGKRELCSVYQDFGGELVTPDVPGSLNFENASADSVCYSVDGNTEKQKVSLTEQEFFGKKEAGAKSLQWDITGAEAGEMYTLYLPYYQEASDMPVHFNMMLQVSTPEVDEEFGFLEMSEVQIKDDLIGEEGELCESNELLDVMMAGTSNCWNQISTAKDEVVEAAGERTLVLTLTTGKDGDYRIRLDDFAVSESNVSEEEFGKTAFYNGTSMATPYVAGAVAALSNAYPKDSTIERIARVKGSVREMEALSGMVKTGGILDLAKAESPVPVFDEIRINESGKLEITGNFFQQKAEVKINGTPAKISSQTEKSIVIDGEYHNKILEMEVAVGEYQYADYCFFAKGKTPEVVAESIDMGSGSSMVSDGNTMYLVNGNGEVFCFTENDAPNFCYDFCEGINGEKIFGDSVNSVQIQSQVVCLNYELYAMAVLENGVAREAAIIKYNADTKEWVKVTAVPDDYSNLDQLDGFNSFAMSSLAVYNGKLYVLGGFDTNSNEAVTSVYVYDTNTKKWTKGISMPKGRFAAKTVQAGDKLIVTLGGDGTENPIENLIFDGNTWTVSAKKISGYEKQYCMYGFPNGEEVSYVDGEIGLIKDGIIYTDCKAEGLGDTFIYNIKEDKYSVSGYSVEEAKGSRELCGASMGNLFYIVSGGGYEVEEGNGTMIYGIQIPDGRCSVTEEGVGEGGNIFGTGTYIPGETVEISVYPWENYYVKSLKINGKAVNANKEGGSTVISNITSDVKVNAEFGAYVSEILLNKTKVSMIAGSKMKLNASVFPENAENKSLYWKSGNTKVVTVDSKGNIKANKKAAGKSAEIIVTAKDRNTVIAKCTVKVRKPVKVKKLKLSVSKNKKTVKAGKSLQIKASFSPKNADNQKLVWSSDNKKYAAVKDGKVKAKKAGIGKRVTITARTKDGSKVKASIKIKIVK